MGIQLGFCNPIDSLKAELKNANDTLEAAILYQISDKYEQTSADSAIVYALKSLEKSLDVNYKLGILKSYIILAHNYIAVGKYDFADSISNLLVTTGKKFKNQNAEAKGYFLIGLSYDYQGLFSQSVKNYIKSLEIMEKIGNMQGVANCYANIGVVYYFEKLYDKALKSYKIAYKYANEHKLDGLEENLLNNIATLHYQKNELDSALVYYKKSQKIIESMQNQSELGIIFGNIGLVFDEKNSLDSALFYHNLSLQNHLKYNNRYGVTNTYKNLGKLYNSAEEYEKAIFHLEKSIELSKEINSLTELVSAYSHIQKSYKAINNIEKAYEYLNEYMLLKDSVISEKSRKEILEIETKYESEKKEKEILKLNEQNALNALALVKKESENQRNILIFSSAGAVILLALIFVYIAFKQKKKINTLILEKNEELNQTNEELAAQRDEIERQKEKVEMAHQEIKDSINYAKRIQNAILPAPSVIRKHLPESFVLYKPKDVVAGDFYWIESPKSNKTTHDNVVLFAVADCTGHGVPGAMVSVVCHNAINRAVREFGLIEPGEILDKTRGIVLSEFEKSEDNVRDGMDIALCSICGNELKYAGANNPLFIIRKNELLEFKANKQPIGNFDNPTPFTTHTIPIEKGDVIYIFSDGYTDQFGGESDKKFSLKKFKTLLITIQNKPISNQKNILNTCFEDWKGNQEQIDDVCVMGVKVG